MEWTLNRTMLVAPEVNLTPTCYELALPCFTSGKTFPDIGSMASFAMNFSPAAGVSLEFARGTNSWQPTRQSTRFDHVWSLMAGPHYMWDSPKARFFVHLLVGVQASNDMPRHAGLQPGGGVERWFGTRVSLRIAFDRVIVPRHGREVSGPRFLVGLGFGIGGD
jgi:hypothetical protein